MEGVLHQALSDSCGAGIAVIPHCCYVLLVLTENHLPKKTGTRIKRDITLYNNRTIHINLLVWYFSDPIAVVGSVD